MKRGSLQLAFIWWLAFLLAALALGETASPPKPRAPRGWVFMFPGGDAKAGQVVFMRMQCYSCHAVKVPGEKPPRDAGGIGPDLTGYSALPKEYLAESIIKAHAVVAAPGYVVREGKAAMGNYNHFMTIQEMIDIVAFLKHGFPRKGR